MRLLIANPFGIGDLLFSLPMVLAVRKSDPRGFLGFLSNRRTAELVERSFPVDWSGVFEKDEFRRQWKRSVPGALFGIAELLAKIRRQKFEAFVDLSLGWQYALAAAWAGIPKRAGFDHRGRGRFLTHRVKLSGFEGKPVARAFLGLLPLVGLKEPKEMEFELNLPEGLDQDLDRFLSSEGMNPQERFLGLVPGGGASWGPDALYKQWPAERFAQAADQIAQPLKSPVLIFGDLAEAPLCRKVASGIRSKTLVVAPAGSLLLLAGLLKRCLLVLGNDSGPMHLASALGVKAVSIFGPVDPTAYGPFVRPSLHRVVSKNLACQPCYRSFRFPPCPFDNACLKTLSTEEVVQGARELIA
ncbi:MAG: glycosyltransferase family 9 protein [Candidatus Omnitrophica bacterium]|nr:glycosyltransferase family 9 protein [Candidatus Omnitrophota bacterium]